MLYTLLQHSQWNRKYHPFLLCCCSPMEGVKGNANHSCIRLSDEEYREKWEHSKSKWERMQERKAGKYTVKTHKNWANENNLGVTHLGCTPTQVPLNSIRFDIMHLKAAVTRRVMNYLRNFMTKQSWEKINSFSIEVLQTFWGRYHVYC